MAGRRLEGRVATVTGGGWGLGAAYAPRLSADGAAVVVADIDQSGANAVSAELERGLAVAADVTSGTDAEPMAAAALEAFGHIDCC